MSGGERPQPETWADHSGRRLRLAFDPDCPAHKPCGGGCVEFGDGDLYLPVAELAAFCARLYAAAGEPAPVILDRPEVSVEGAKGVNVFRVLLDDGDVRIGYGSHKAASVAPPVARLLASVIAAYADLADSELDPDDVAELAEEIRSEVTRIGGSPRGLCEIAARTALRWTRQREGDRDG